MSTGRVWLLVGAIIQTFTMLLGMIFTAILVFSPEFIAEMGLEGMGNEVIIVALMVAFSIIIGIISLTWLAFAFFERDKSKGWRVYILLAGIFYLVMSMLNGPGIIGTLPVAICFIMAYRFKLNELKNKKELD